MTSKPCCKIALKPIAAIRNPPTQNTQWNRRSHAPPEWQRNIRQQAQDGPYGPKHLSFHPFILARIGTRDIAMRLNDNTSHSLSAIRDIEPESQPSAVDRFSVAGSPGGTKQRIPPRKRWKMGLSANKPRRGDTRNFPAGSINIR